MTRIGRFQAGITSNLLRMDPSNHKQRQLITSNLLKMDPSNHKQRQIAKRHPQ